LVVLAASAGGAAWWWNTQREAAYRARTACADTTDLDLAKLRAYYDAAPEPRCLERYGDALARLEEAAWTEAQAADDPRGYEAFLRTYPPAATPAPAHAAAAQARLAALQAAALAPTPAPSATVSGSRGAPTARFAGLWQEVDVARGQKAITLDVDEGPAGVSVAHGAPAGSWTMMGDTARFENDRLGCAPPFRHKGFTYDGPNGAGSAIFSLRRNRESLIYVIETHWTSPCDGHSGTERKSHRFVREK
jgi:hypothetical protein